VAALEEAVQRMEQAGMSQLQGWFGAFLAEAYARCGRRDEAVDVAERAVAVTREVGFDLGLAVALRARGRIELESGDRTGAAARLREALALFESLGVPLEAARTRSDLARAQPSPEPTYAKAR
jgi:hypothetical protein